VDPFNTEFAKRAFSVWYMDVGSLPAAFNGDPVIDLAKNYAEKCEEQAGKDMKYIIVLSKGGKTYRAFAHMKREVLSVPISMGSPSENDKMKFVHEFGHLFAGLADEYLLPGAYRMDPTFPNCAKDEEQAMDWAEQMGMDARAYGDFKYKGCGGDCVMSVCSGYIRPSQGSIMADHKRYKEFNEPSKWMIEQKVQEISGGLAALPTKGGLF